MIEMLLFYQESLLGALVLALGCSVLGVYVVLRRIVFVGAALAQLSSAGVGLAVFVASTGLGLGWLTLHGMPGNVPPATGAKGLRGVGSVTPSGARSP